MPDPISDIEPLVGRLRRRLSLVVLGEGEAASKASDAMLQRHLRYASRTVAATVARGRPEMLTDSLRIAGTASIVGASLTVLSVTVDGEPAERRPLRSVLKRPAGRWYCLADGRLLSSGTAAVEALRAPVASTELPPALHDAVIEEAAASVMVALGGDAPQAWGRATDALELVLR